MNDELKACPFCGSDAMTSDDGDYVWCNGHRNSCPGYVGSRVEKWNRRPLEDALTAERDALETKLEIAVEALKKIDSPTYQGPHPMQIARDALAAIEKVGKQE
jgi:hypothetical protein